MSITIIRRREREEGVALLITLMVLMLVSALMVGFVAAVIADTRASGLDRDQTQAYAASHAGLEQMTSDLAGLFTRTSRRRRPQIAGLTANPPALPGFTFIAPGRPVLATRSASQPTRRATRGRRIRQRQRDHGRALPGISRHHHALQHHRDRADSRGGAEVRMRRTLQTVAMPVFQFGMFSETDLASRRREAFGFGGRVHTNGNLFLAPSDGDTLTLAGPDDRGQARSSGRTRQRVGRLERLHGATCGSSANAPQRLPEPGAERGKPRHQRLRRPERAAVDRAVGWHLFQQYPQRPDGRAPPGFAARGAGRRAGGLDPPAHATANENTARPGVYNQRFFGQAAVRILLSDTAAEIQQLPTVTQGTQPVALFRPLTSTRHSITRRSPPTRRCPALLSGTTRRRVKHGDQAG